MSDYFYYIIITIIAVLALDDDRIVTEKSLMFAFSIWKVIVINKLNRHYSCYSLADRRNFNIRLLDFVLVHMILIVTGSSSTNMKSDILIPSYFQMQRSFTGNT